jgi:hypothetical protein
MHCAAHGLHDAALVLVYATIERMAWLHRAPGHPEAMRSDFMAWVEVDLLPGSGLTCSALELYAARCEILHGGPPRMVREGVAARLAHTWEDTAPSPGVVPVPALLRALGRAIQMWNSRMSSSSST